jgi:ring-1,2-phenylacetyl-CoA epoxidase subunit PaaD
MEKAEPLTEQTIWDTLRQIPDPELPAINLVDLGVIRKVEVGDSICVELLPTFIGCPALDMMRREIMEKLAPYGEVEVKIIYSDAWTTECISEAGREMLRQAKIVPPPVPDHAAPPGHASSPTGAAPAVEHGNFIELPTRASRLTRRSHAPDTPVAVSCPYCGSSNTSQENLFGPTPCRAICYCHNCHQPFERFKTV